MPDILDRLKSALSDRYAIEREVGSGGMATVYLAKDIKHHRKVAVKVLRPDLAAALGPERFLREIEIAAQLQHPHVLPLYDSGEADGFLYYVMPYVEGESLRAKLAREGELPVDEAIRILRDVVDALTDAHAHGVVHRDIKPDNVLLTGHHAVVTDFGVAKAVSEATGREKMTTAGVALGTPAYMAPEQAAADPHIDHRADIYAVGALAYELLSGQPPFTGATPQMVLSAHVTETPTPVTAHRAAVHPALAQIVMRCLEKKPADRWQSAEELLHQLEAATTPSVGITPTDTRPVTAAVPRRNKTKYAVIGSAAVVAVIAVVTLLILPGRGTPLVPERVVVGVFENQTGDPSLDPVGRMAADWITQGLQQTRIVDVIPSPTALQSSRHIQAGIQAGRIVDPVRALAEETGAGTVVSGTYYRDGDDIRFQAQVTDARAGKLLGALEPVTGTLESPVDAVERLRERIMGFLALSFDQRLAASAGIPRQPPTFEAYQAFNEGMEEYLGANYREALSHFYLAFELDSSFVVPLLFAAINHLNLGEFAEGDSLLNVAAEYRDELSEYHRHWLDYLQAYVDGDHQRSLRAMRLAANMAPGSKSVYNLAFAAEITNRPREALGAAKKLDPERGAMRGWWNYWLRVVRAHHLLGDFERALEAAEQARQQYPHVPSILTEELSSLAALGRFEQIVARLEEGISLLPPGSRGTWTPGLAIQIAAGELRAHGYSDAAFELLDSAAAWYSSRPTEEAQTETHRQQLADALYAAERWEQAGAVVHELAAEFPDNLGYQGRLGVLAARNGDQEKAAMISKWLEQLDRPYLRGVNTLWRARIAAVLDERERAVNLLQDAISQGQAYFRLHLDFDLVEPLRDYPPFQELLRPKG